MSPQGRYIFLGAHIFKQELRQYIMVSNRLVGSDALDSFESFKENATSLAKTTREKSFIFQYFRKLQPFQMLHLQHISRVFSSKLRMHVINNVRLTFFVFIAIEGLSESLIDNIWNNNEGRQGDFEKENVISFLMI